jgi:muramoyltetrapeptide carboxypeptidase
MITPPYLKQNDIIGIVSPAKSIERSLVENAVCLLERQGYRIKLGAHVFDAEHRFAGSDKNRAADFQQMLDDKEVTMILCSRGGYGSVRILDTLNFDKFKRNPKWIAGYSDITVFHAHLNILGYESLHAEMPLNFPQSEPCDFAFSSLLKAAAGKQLSYEIEANTLNRAGRCEGDLTGGNLSLFLSLMGSRTELSTGGKILFLEEVGENLYRLDRMMMTMKRAGKLCDLAGLIIGGLNKMEDDEVKFGKSAEEIVAEVVLEYNYPVCFNFPAGHISDNRALILGRKVLLDIGNRVKIEFSDNQ